MRIKLLKIDYKYKLTIVKKSLHLSLNIKFHCFSKYTFYFYNYKKAPFL